MVGGGEVTACAVAASGVTETKLPFLTHFPRTLAEAVDVGASIRYSFFACIIYSWERTQWKSLILDDEADRAPQKPFDFLIERERNEYR